MRLKLTDKPHSIVVIPPHLVNTPWIDFEKHCLLSVYSALYLQLGRLPKKLSAKNVHDSRVAIRRFLCLWSVLKQDGWQSKKVKSKVIEKLKELLAVLGCLRDWDVTLEVGSQLNCGQKFLLLWGEKRHQSRHKVKSIVSIMDEKLILRKLHQHIIKRAKKLKKTYKKTNSYAQLDQIISLQEESVRKLERKADSPKMLHKLRLQIKRWRYLITEFYQVTNQELVNSQQVLGKFNDYERLEKLLGKKINAVLSHRLKTEKAQQLDEFRILRKSLPYGLRPLWISTDWQPN